MDEIVKKNRKPAYYFAGAVIFLFILAATFFIVFSQSDNAVPDSTGDMFEKTE